MLSCLQERSDGDRIKLQSRNTLQSSIDLVQLRHAKLGGINHGCSLSSSDKFTVPNLRKILLYLLIMVLNKYDLLECF